LTDAGKALIYKTYFFCSLRKGAHTVQKIAGGVRKVKREYAMHFETKKEKITK
jgi:hypothetical protein